VEIALYLKRTAKMLLELGTRNLDCAELLKMARHELRIQHAEAPINQTRGEMDQRDLAGVALKGKHRFPEKRAIQMHAVKAAHQPAVQPGLSRTSPTACAPASPGA
jgi:hypothetical protein